MSNCKIKQEPNFCIRLRELKESCQLIDMMNFIFRTPFL